MSPDKLRADGIAPPLHVPHVKVETKTEEDRKIEFIDLTLGDDVEPPSEPREIVLIDLTIDDLDELVFPKNESNKEVTPILVRLLLSLRLFLCSRTHSGRRGRTRISRASGTSSLFVWNRPFFAQRARPRSSNDIYWPVCSSHTPSLISWMYP